MAADIPTKAIVDVKAIAYEAEAVVNLETHAVTKPADVTVFAGDTVKGTVISVKKHEILVDLGAQGVGLVPRREASFARNLNPGDEVSASVIEAEMDDGYVLLSLRKAVKDKGWDEI
ncbi:MAG: S1 RNA-binding domain-containing protein, partial [Firmicutes bacterium]|nr:S1 RNA-binding domain-containing protein [Bacillota bacterium]